MSLSLNQPTPRLNDLLLRGGDDLSPELKEQALDDILAEFGSAPAKKAPAQTAPMPKPERMNSASRSAAARYRLLSNARAARESAMSIRPFHEARSLVSAASGVRSAR